jgi:hypothetical protein
MAEKYKKGIRAVRQRSTESFLLFIVLLVLISFFLFWDVNVIYAADIPSVNVKILNNEIYVSTSLLPDKKFISDLNNGLSKEITFFIDLFRVWKIWPDEFVYGLKLTKVLKSDTIKREYIATNIVGNNRTEKRFRDVDSMIEWALNISDIKLLNVKEFEKGDYFIKVTVESKIRKLPPVIGYFLFFIPETEFSISKRSIIFSLGKDENI